MAKYITPTFSTDEITIIDAGYETDARKPPIGPKPKFHYTLYIVLSGEVLFQTSPLAEPTIVHGGQIYAVYPQDPILFKPLMDEPLEQFFIGFEAKNDEIIRHIGLSKNAPVRDFTNVKQVSKAFHKLLDGWNRSRQDKYCFLLNFYALLNCLHIKNSDINTSKSPFQDIFSMAIAYMEENLHRNMTINELTSHLKIDRSYFSKIFKKQFGFSPYKYYLRLKFLKAQTLLLSTNFTITQICETLGFSDVSTFSQAFERHFHCRPTKMRKNIQAYDNRKTADYVFKHKKTNS